MGCSEHKGIIVEDVSSQSVSDVEALDNRQNVDNFSVESDFTGMTDENNESIKSNEPTMIYVYVCGAVCNPGVVEVEEGSRAELALEKAGGFAEGANTVYVNLAAKLKDGQRLFFPYLDESLNMDYVLESGTGINGTEVEVGINGTGISGEADGSAGFQDMYPVNINIADATTLCNIPGVGPSRAEAIIDYRTSYGPFTRTEDIMNVSGIGETSYNKMCSYICVY